MATYGQVVDEAAQFIMDNLQVSWEDAQFIAKGIISMARNIDRAPARPSYRRY